MSENEIIEMIEQILDCDLSAKNLRDDIPQWDSLKQIEIIFALEDKYSIEFSEEETDELASLDGIISLIKLKISKSGR